MPRAVPEVVDSFGCQTVTAVTFRAAVLPPVLGPVMMTDRTSGRTNISMGTCQAVTSTFSNKFTISNC